MVKVDKVTIVKSTKSSSKDKKSGKSGSSSGVITKSDGASEIDNLFESLKTKKIEKIKLNQEALVKKVKKIKVDDYEPSSSSSYGIIKSSYNFTEITNPEAPLERIDKESGLPVYKAHLLKVGEGGGTELCPFDCNCCF
jgi:hypothetical protein